MTSNELAELRSLLDALCEEVITPEQVSRLEELVLHHPEAEAHYVQYMHMFAELGRHFGGGACKVPNQEQKPPEAAAQLGPQAQPPRTRIRLRRAQFVWGSLGLLALAACLFLALTLPRPLDFAPPVHQGEREEPTDDSVAVLLRAPGAEWEPTNLPTRVGSPLRAGVLKLKSGGAQIEFYSGATVILEGPAEFHLLSRTEGYCAHGKLLATVPQQAHGFKIGSPSLNLVDRGTEFGMVVGDRTEVHVFQGKVELHDPGSSQSENMMKELITGQSVRLEKVGLVSPIAPNPAGFLRAEDLRARYQEDVRRRHQDWLTACGVLRRDLALEVFYRFGIGQISGRSVPNESGNFPSSRDGAVVGCSSIAGRWPGGKALEFKQVSDRVRFNVPGEFKSLTLMAWVRVDALPNRNNSLMMTDGWEEGGLHWQIGNDGKLILGVQSSPRGQGGHYHAVSAVPPQLFGQWLHLAVVYDQAQKHVTHYVNGRQAAQVPILFDIALRIGNAELGNWNIASHRNSCPVRFFTGGMDEFMIFSRPFSADEIARLHAQGQCEQ